MAPCDQNPDDSRTVPICGFWTSISKLDSNNYINPFAWAVRINPRVKDHAVTEHQGQNNLNIYPILSKVTRRT